MDKVIIIGGSHHNTLSMVRAIGKKGISPDVILVDSHPEDSFVIASKYIHKYYSCNTEIEALSILKKEYSKANDECFVIASSDGIASIMDLHYDELKDKFKFFNCSQQGLLTHYMDKLVQVNLASECGIEVPVSIVHHVGVDSIEFDIFPCIVKPLESIHGGKKINICSDIDSLKDAITGYSHGDTVLIQQFIKRDYEIVVDGVSIDDKVFIPGCIKKIRDHKGGTNFSTTHSVAQLPQELVDKIVAYVKKMHFQGLFGVELIVSNGKYYFVEINLRNDATIYSLACAGVNLPYIFVDPSSIEEESNKPIRNIKAIVEIRDFRDAVMHRKVSIFRWWKDYKESECKFYYTQDDPEPFYVARKTLVNQLKRKIFHI